MPSTLWQHSNGKLLQTSLGKIMSWDQCPCCASSSQSLSVVIAGATIDNSSGFYSSFALNTTYTCTWTGSQWESSSFTIAVYNNGGGAVNVSAKIQVQCATGFYLVIVNVDNAYMNLDLSYGTGVTPPQRAGTAIDAELTTSGSGAPGVRDPIGDGTATVTVIP